MKAVALLGVFVIAKIVVIAGRPIQLSGWWVIAYFWQDLLVTFSFALLNRLIDRVWFERLVYVLLVGYVAINVPVARILSTPLTWPMLDAAGPALADSIKRHLTVANLALMILVVVVGTALPFLARIAMRGRDPRGCVLNGPGSRFENCTGGPPWPPVVALVVSISLLTPVGRLANSRVETIGLERNAIMSLATTSFRRISASASDLTVDEDWRTSPFDSARAAEDLSRFRGKAAGRNVVLVVLESAAARYLRPYGAGLDPMPNLSKLADSAIVFEHAYAVYPESIKGLFSVLCSRYPAMDTTSESYAWAAAPSIAVRLKEEGYRTALFHSGRFMYLGMYAVVANRGYEVLEDAGAIGGNHESSFGVDEPSTVRRALEWIDSLEPDEQFFLTYLPIAGHHPYDTPEPGPFPEQQESDRYLNALHYADSSLGALIEGLRERGLDRRTLFVVFGDHGEAFGQHEGNFGHSLFLYEENLRVPYLLAAPDLIEEQERVSNTISLIDTAPTIFDLLGLSAAAGAQGASALDGPPRMALFFTDYSFLLLGLRDGSWKYIYEMDSGRSKLFDLSVDADESRDLSSAHPERVAAYRALVDRWSAAQKSLTPSG